MTPLEKLNVEEALEAAFQSGFDLGRATPAPGWVSVERENGYNIARKEFIDDEQAQRRRAKLDLAKAVAQAIAGLATLVEETGGIR